MTEKIDIRVRGMQCSNCEKRVKEALTKIKGIKKVEVSIKNENVIIELDRKDIKSINNIIQVINGLGYTASFE